MGKKDPRVDAYIGNAADFAKPILKELRAIVHQACPDCEETLKWRNPAFIYKGLLAGMVAFKEHCVFMYWKSDLIVDASGRKDSALETLGRLTSVDDLPPKAMLVKWTKGAATLNDRGVTVKRTAAPKKPLRTPAYLGAALAKNKKAGTVFDTFSPSKQRDYIEWLTEAKTDATRNERLATAVKWISEGKSWNWKYEKR